MSKHDTITGQPLLTEIVQSFADKVSDFCEETGLTEFTVYNKATSNTHLLERMRRKAERMEGDMKRVNDYMEKRRASSRPKKKGWRQDAADPAT